MSSTPRVTTALVRSSAHCRRHHLKNLKFIIIFSIAMMNEAAATKTVTLNIRNQTTVTVTRLAMKASLYEVMEQAEKEGNLS